MDLTENLTDRKVELKTKNKTNINIFLSRVQLACKKNGSHTQMTCRVFI